MSYTHHGIPYLKILREFKAGTTIQHGDATYDPIVNYPGLPHTERQRDRERWGRPHSHQVIYPSHTQVGVQVDMALHVSERATVIGQRHTTDRSLSALPLIYMHSQEDV